MPVRAANDRLRGRTNDRARQKITDFLGAGKLGNTFTVGYLTALLNGTDLRTSFSQTRTGRLLAERSDVRKIDTGVWEVVR